MIGNELKVYDGLTSRQQLNLFRNLYYNDGNATEYGIIANAINDCLTADVAPKSEVAREIFEEIELFLNKAIDGWRKEESFACDSRKIEMIEFRIGAFKYCLYEIAELKKKYTEERENDKGKNKEEP